MLNRLFALFLISPLLLGSPVFAQDADLQAQAREYNEAAVQAFSNGNYEDALAGFLQAYELNKTEPVIKRNIARCYAHIALENYKKRAFYQSARDYKLAEDYDPANPNYGFFRSQALVEDSKNDDAIRVLLDYLKRFPKQGRAHRLLGKAYYNLNRSSEALESFKAALKLDKNDKLAAHWIARVGKESSAEKTLKDDYSTIHFNIKFSSDADATLGRRLGRMLENAYENVGREFGVYPEGSIAVVIYPNKSFARVTGVYGWVGALYDGKIRIPGRSVTKLGDAELDRILHHEYCHALISRLAGSKCPTWLHEGLAQILERNDGVIARKLVGKNAVSLKQLKGRFVSVKNPIVVRKLYASSLLFTEYLRNQGASLWVFKDILEGLGKGKKLDDLFKQHLGDDLTTLYDNWVRQL